MSETKTIGKDFTTKELIKFVSVPVISKLIISLLNTLDDSLFISRYCGQNALASFTIALPWFMLIDAVVMVICAVSTKCSMLMGEKKNDEAMSSFTSMAIIGFFVGLFFTVILSLFKTKILILLGATEELLPLISEYMSISRLYIPLIVETNIFGRFYSVAGRPKMNVLTNGIQIFCNLFFDWLFIARNGIGIIGAAYANLIGNICITIVGLIFYSNQKHEVHFAKPLDNPWPLFKEVFKLGRAQGLTSLAISANSIVINYVLLYYGGEDLVACYTIVTNVQFLFMNAFFGFIGSVSPIISYAYGEKNADKLSKRMKQSVVLIEALSAIVGLFIFVMKKPIIFLYFGNDVDIATSNTISYGLNIVSLTYAFMSFNILVQEFSVAVGNPRMSATLSILENIVFCNMTIVILPMIVGVNGIWYYLIVAEIITFAITCYAVYSNRDVYGYGKDKIASFVNQ